MKPVATFIGMTAMVAIALAAGYWWGSKHTVPASTQPQQTAAKQPRILYYRNPMGLPDTSPVPKKDEMGMDYIPVYEGEASTGGQVTLGTEKIQKLGVRTEAVAKRVFSQQIRAVGAIQVDEQRVYAVSPRFEGWIEQLKVNATGQPVRRGQILMEVYSPELISAQEEYALAEKAGMHQLAQSSLARLRNWGIDEAQIGELGLSAQAHRTLGLRAPQSGIVLEKAAVAGMRFMPGETLYKIADLSTVWVIAEVFEQDLARVRTGQNATVKVNAYPAQEFTAKVTYVYPTLNAQTRTTPVRLEIHNPDGLLKPGMYAEVSLRSADKRQAVLVVPSSAVIDSGTRQVTLVEVAPGRFEPREVKLGQRGSDYVEVLSGLGEGEKVVTSANFLIDAESNLKAALSAFGGTGAEPAGKHPDPETPRANHESH